MEQWLRENLSRVLGFDVPDDLIQYITSIETEPDFNDYMKTLLDFENPQHKNFFTEMSKKKFPNKGAIPKQKKKISKNKLQQEVFPNEPVKQEPQEEGKEGKKKKTKFVNLYSQEGKNAQVVLLKGRHACDCEASRHELINNCLECGRVVCSQEGSGPCLFCGALVCTEEEENQINSNSKGGIKLKDALLERERPKGWEEAVAHRNRLLDYDQNSEKRTEVLDDDSDYFNTGSVWLKPEEREKLEQYQKELREKKHASRLSKKMTFDFAGRQIVEDNTIEHAVDVDKIRAITGQGAGAGAGAAKGEFVNDMLAPSAGRILAPGTDLLAVQDVEPKKREERKPVTRWEKEAQILGKGATSGARMGEGGKVQDKELQLMTDQGRCLSMHQPWASLLVEGIKLHEGRTWYTSHRGRLWIASTAKPPDPHEVKAVENRYRALSRDKEIMFPSFYPTGCLLGCVDVDDVLPQEEYDKLYPEGESDSPYVFICSNPQSLKLRFPVKGQHKIYPLDKTIHLAAVKCLQNMARERAEEAHAHAG